MSEIIPEFKPGRYRDIKPEIYLINDNSISSVELVTLFNSVDIIYHTQDDDKR